jgi:hypothetical protein
MKGRTTNPVADTVPSSGASGSGPSGVPEGNAHESGSVPSSMSLPQPNCLTDDDVMAFLHGGMPRQRLDRIDGHIDECVHCFELIRAATPDAEILDASHGFLGLTLRTGALAGGRYRIARFVDRGGMGEVYEARDIKLDERVALKTVLCTSGDSTQAVRKLFAEVQLARRIAHRHVCRIYDLHEHRDGPDSPLVHFLTMEYIEGEKLSRYLSSRRLPVDEACGIARQLLLGLEAAHEAGVLHLDFKSDNVMLRAGSATPEAIVMDFGLSRALDAQSRLRTSEQNQIAGSLAYMAPEQVECQHVLGKAADIYAFGVVLFEMLTGRLPFEGPSPAAVMYKRLKSTPPTPSSLRAEIPKALDDFVLTCLSREPRLRYLNATKALAALEAIDLSPEAARGARPGGRRMRSRVGLLIAIALGVLLLGAFVRHRTAPEARVAAPARVPAEASAPLPEPARPSERSPDNPSASQALRPMPPAPEPSPAPPVAAAQPKQPVAKKRRSGAAHVGPDRTSAARVEVDPAASPPAAKGLPEPAAATTGLPEEPAAAPRKEPRLPGAPPRLR